MSSIMKPYNVELQVSKMVFTISPAYVVMSLHSQLVLVLLITLRTLSSLNQLAVCIL